MEEHNTYELGFLLTPLVAEEQAAVLIDEQVRQPLIKASGEIKSEVAPKLINLAYPIKKTLEHKSQIFREAFLGVLNFTATAEVATKVNQFLKKSPAVIRFLLLKLKPETKVSKIRLPINQVTLDQEIDKLCI